MEAGCYKQYVCFIGEIKKEDASGMLQGEHWDMWCETISISKGCFFTCRYYMRIDGSFLFGGKCLSILMGR